MTFAPLVPKKTWDSIPQADRLTSLDQTTIDEIPEARH